MRAGRPLGFRSLRSESLRRGAAFHRPTTLLLLLLGGAWGCAPAPDEPPPRAADPHGDLACVSCHDGPLPRGRVALAEPEGCARAGCHDAAAAPHAGTRSGALFAHADHEGGRGVVASCSGCHTHRDGRGPLTLGTETCGLCHAADLARAGPSACVSCHPEPPAAGVTSQGIRIDHRALPWTGGDCVRCHYDVTPEPTPVPSDRCATCHGTALDAIPAASGLHATHPAPSCASCHPDPLHRIVSMSSAVRLACAACHGPSPELSASRAGAETELCNGCHAPVHQPVQRLFLGLPPGGASPEPAVHFRAGLTCTSCHAAGGVASPPAAADRCADCHRAEMARVAEWWLLASDLRVQGVARYLGEARRRLRDTPGAEAHLDRAEALLALVREGGGVHNPPLAHHALGDAVEQVREAYGLAGSPAPEAPPLGTQPTPRTCASCHWAQSPSRERGTLEMTDALHRDLMRPPPATRR